MKFHFEVSRGRFRIWTLRCPEVGLEFPLRGVKRSDETFKFEVFGAEGELIPGVTPLPESRATARRREENVFGVLNVMGGLAGGRVRSRNRRGIPKKKSCSLNSVSPALRVIQRQGKFDSRRRVKQVRS